MSNLHSSHTHRQRPTPIILVAACAMALVGATPSGAPEPERLAAQQPAGEPVDGFVWPIADRLGNVVLGFGVVPHPRTGDDFFNNGYFIAAPAGSAVVAMHDGVIATADRYHWKAADKPVSVGWNNVPPTAAELEEVGAKASEVHGIVGLDVGNGLRVWYSGLSLAPGLQKGKPVKAGDVLGQVYGIKNFYDEPVIHVSGSRPQPVDLGPYLFGKTYVPKPLPAAKPRDPAKLYTSKELLNDLDLVWSALQEAHPALYDYTSHEEFARLLAESRRSLAQPATAARFNVVLRRLLARIGCGHIQASLATLGRQARVFPLDVRIIAGRVYVVGGTVPSGAVPVRSEILSINDEPAAAVLGRLRDLVTSDGRNLSGKEARLSQPATFRGLFHALYGEVPAFRVRLARPDGRQDVVSLPAVSQDQAASWPSAVAASRTPPKAAQAIRYLAPASAPPEHLGATARPRQSSQPFTASGGGPDLAYWKIASFGLFDHESIHRIFEELETRHVTGLVIDVRGNSGGDIEELEYLYSFLSPREFRLKVSSQATRRTYSFQGKTANLVEGAVVNDDLQPVAGRTGFYRFATTSQPATDHQYAGQLYVLMDGGTFSAAADFCGLVHRDRRGVLVGEETGGGYYQLTAEKFAQLLLPSLPTTVVIPLRKIVTTDVADQAIPSGRGVMPDHAVSRTVDDYLDPDKDAMLDYAVKLFRRGVPAAQTAAPIATVTLKQLNDLLATHCANTPALTLEADGTVVRKDSGGPTWMFKLGDIGEMAIDREVGESHVVLSCRGGSRCVDRVASIDGPKDTIGGIAFSIHPADQGDQVLKLFKDLQTSWTAGTGK